MRKIILFSLALLLSSPALILAQTEFVDSTNKRFDGRDPKIGTVIPDIKAWDEQGKEFQLGSSRGKYTVIIFGCLT